MAHPLAVPSPFAVDFALNKIKSDEEILKLVHRLFYRTPGKATVIKKNIRAFSGFPEDADRGKAKDVLDRAFAATLNAILDLFDLPRGVGEEGKKEAKVARLMAWLEKPSASDKKNLKVRASRLLSPSRALSEERARPRRSSAAPPPALFPRPLTPPPRSRPFRPTGSRHREAREGDREAREGGGEEGEGGGEEGPGGGEEGEGGRGEVDGAPLLRRRHQEGAGGDGEEAGGASQEVGKGRGGRRREAQGAAGVEAHPG